MPLQAPLRGWARSFGRPRESGGHVTTLETGSGCRRARRACSRTGNMAATAAARIALRLSHHRGGLAPASSSLGRVSPSSCSGLLAAVRRYTSEAKGLEEELRVRYLDDEHKGNGNSRRGRRGRVFFFFVFNLSVGP